MTKIITQKTKGKAKERSKDTHLIGTNKGRELIPFVVGGYFTYIPSNVTCM
jgi:hypothetical protein